MWYGAGALQIHLIEVPEGADVGQPPQSLTPVANHVAFAVANYDATVAALEQRGLERLETSAELGQLWVRDPDGHVVELTSRRG